MSTQRQRSPSDHPVRDWYHPRRPPAAAGRGDEPIHVSTSQGELLAQLGWDELRGPDDKRRQPDEEA